MNVFRLRVRGLPTGATRAHVREFFLPEFRATAVEMLGDANSKSAHIYFDNASTALRACAKRHGAWLKYSLFARASPTHVHVSDATSSASGIRIGQVDKAVRVEVLEDFSAPATRVKKEETFVPSEITQEQLLDDTKKVLVGMKYKELQAQRKYRSLNR